MDMWKRRASKVTRAQEDPQGSIGQRTCGPRREKAPSARRDRPPRGRREKGVGPMGPEGPERATPGPSGPTGLWAHGPHRRLGSQGDAGPGAQGPSLESAAREAGKGEERKGENWRDTRLAQKRLHGGAHGAEQVPLHQTLPSEIRQDPVQRVWPLRRGHGQVHLPRDGVYYFTYHITVFSRNIQVSLVKNGGPKSCTPRMVTQAPRTRPRAASSA